MSTASAGKLYDYPAYYDLIFGADWRDEFSFLCAAFRRYAARDARHVFEPACGTARLLIRLAMAGYRVSGLDLNAAAIKYAQTRFARAGLPARLFVADMSDFQLPRAADAAFNLINSFRHLPDENASVGHLRCMAQALAPGGVYLLGLHLTPTGVPVCTTESWSAKRGRVSAKSTMWTIDIDRRRRQERVGMSVSVAAGSKRLRFNDEFIFRTYSAGQMAALLRRVPELEVAATHDFGYDVDAPIEIDERSEDVIYVLRKRG